MDRTTRGLESGNGISSLKTYCHWSTALDTALHKDSPRDFTAHSSFSISRSKVSKRKQGVMSGAKGTGNPLLTLGLGSSPSSSDSSKLSSGTACVTSSSLIKDMDEESSVDLGLNLGFYVGNDIVPWQQKSHVGVKIMPLTNSPKLDLQLSLSTGSPESVIIDANMMSPDSLDMPMTNSSPVIMGKGSVPHNWGFEHSVVSSSYASEAAYAFPFPKKIDEGNASVPSPVISSTMFTSVKRCMKGARGASGRCIAHGGGRHCQKPGCLKGAEGTTIYCKAHGGGRRCQFLGCTKSAEGCTDHCIAHGGGRRCSHEGCSRAARGKSGLCIKHGGGKRCQKENCTKSAEGHSGLCIAHGGGKRCQFPDCTKGAQGSTKFCKAHGGGKRCTFLGCTRGAEGSTAFCKGHGGGKRCAFQGGGVCPKSVHGGTQYCVAHGGGKRCASTGCTKSARGRTEYCVRHGGGKRCKSEGCTKSAQGSTDFCKAHGGGKRCSWGQAEVSFGIGTQQCDRFVRSKTGFCSAHSALVQDHCVHGGGTLGPAIHQFVADVKPTEMKVAAVQVDPHEKTIHGDQALLGVGGSVPNGVHPSVLAQPMIYPLPEGRVHGGGLLALLSQGRSSTSAGGSENCASGKISWM
ncbi:hypothetical protein PVAP13_5NG280400 [Panicum virgatum]|uniref:WRKY19-like zinc finger domain-containing protein n=1 Tax=Panicum virgatum TaxID=38727 RepID=A0A8T0RXF8_PANVG|nr:hypothetical protein PVAP13_5NG280400 [Panicum virgatum]